MELETIELFIDEENIKDGVQAISLVENPAIEENFVALNKHKVEFKTIDEEKRIIVGYALVPDKKILRIQNDKKFNIKFSKDTVYKACELYSTRLKNNNTTLDHEKDTNGVSVIQSWIVDNVKMDKVNLYGLNPIEGGWAVIMKVYNDEVWEGVKNKKYLGLSIEGIFSDEIIEQSKSLETIEKTVDELTEDESEFLIKEIIKAIEKGEL
jgi:hypothetical protein